MLALLLAMSSLRAAAAASVHADDDLSDEIDIHASAEPGTVLMLPGKRFPLDFRGGEFTLHATPVFIAEEPNTGLGTGLTIWDGAVVLAKYLEHNPRLAVAGKRVVEVGAGAGLVGISASVLGAAHVALTDLPYTLNNTRRSIEFNRGSLRGEVTAEALDWFAPTASGANIPCRPHLILGADVVWVDTLIAPLAATLSWLFQLPPCSPAATDSAVAASTEGSLAAAGDYETVCLIAHQTRARSSDAAFFDALDGHGLSVSHVPFEDHHPRFRDRDIMILSVTAPTHPFPRAEIR